MPSEMRSSGSVRPLLSNGEALKIDVTAPRPSGGPKYEPQTDEQAREYLQPQLAATRELALGLDPDVRGDRIYIEARLLPNYIAASSYPSGLLTQIGAAAVGSRYDKGIYRTKNQEKIAGTRRLILSIDDAGLRAFSKLVADRGEDKTERQAFHEIRKLDEITLSVPPPKLYSTDSKMWEAVLHPDLDDLGKTNPASDVVMQKWFNLIERLEGRVYRDYIRIVGGLTFTPIHLPTGAAQFAARFNPLRVLRPLPEIRPRPTFGTRSVPKLSAPNPWTHDPALPRVAVFDGGLTHQSALFPDACIDLTPELPDLGEQDHGTAVMGAAMYGLAIAGSVAGVPPLPLDSYRVMPPANSRSDVHGYWVLDQIVKVIREKRHCIVNLSLGPVMAVEDDQEPDLWTSTLDELAWEHDILFVVAAGNFGESNRALGLHRVQVPADMANGISVGASDYAQPQRPWGRAPYSSMGPGRQGSRVQPICLQFGGVEDVNEIPILKADGKFLSSWGTSFAAPLVTHALSELVTQIPSYNPNVLRAFTAHFAERHPKHKKLQDEVGFGRAPLSFEPHLICTPDEVHVLYTDSINRGELLGYQVPIPAGASSNLELRITLAYASPINSAEPTEYTRASIELAFRPHEQIFNFRPPAGQSGRTQTLDQRTREALNLIGQGWKESQEPVTKGLGSKGPTPEAKLRDDGKWETVRHTRIQLGVAEYQNPRLEATYISRQAGGALDSTPSSVGFAILISVFDKSKSGSLYDQVAAQFAALRPIQRIRPRLQVRNRLN